MAYKDEVKQNICEAVNMLHKAKDEGILNKDGSHPDIFVEHFIELCKLRYGNCGLDVATEAFAQYGRNKMSKSFFRTTEHYNLKTKPNKKVQSIPDKFSVSNRTRTCDFGREIYHFISNKKRLL